MNVSIRHWGKRLIAIGSVALLAGCGGSSSPSSPSTPTPVPTPAPVKTLVTQGSSSNLAANHVHIVRFTTTSTGRIDSTVDWTLSSDSMRVVIATGSNTCFDGTFINFSICNKVSDIAGASKPTQTSLPGQPAGPYTLYIDNLGPNTEAVSWQVFVTIPG